MDKSKSFDPITLEVMRNAFYSIADEMIVALIRASYSTNIKDRRDTSCAIYTATGDVVVVAQSEIGTPLHLGTMHSAVQSAMKSYPFDQLVEGDAIATNTPYPAGPGHLNDLCLISPIFHRGKLIAITANQAHHVDMGGFAPGSMPFGVHEIFQEGFQIPPIKLFRQGKLYDEFWNLISNNVRTPVEVKGDLLAQFAANTVGAKRLNELADKYSVKVIDMYLQEMLNYSERRMKQALKQIPEGNYSYSDFIEGDGIDDKLFKIELDLNVKGDSIIADFSSSDDASKGPLNCRWPSVAACVYYILKAVLDPELPPNAGAYRPIQVKVRDGSLLSAQYPNAVCNANIITTQRIVDCLLGALSSAIPDKVAAASSGTMNLLNIGGVDDRSGIYYNYVETYGGGQGAMHDSDGMDAVQNHMTNTRNAPVESIEVAYPLLVEGYGLVPDSEGAGKFRGGMGLQRKVRVLGPGVSLTLSSDRAKITPWGLFGGEASSPSNCIIEDDTGENHNLPSKVTTQVENQKIISTVTPGGGGWGNPKDREPELVLKDVIMGLVSIERAKSVYGVNIDANTMTVISDSNS